MNEAEIKPCPLCGNKAELITRGNSATKKRSAEIYCKPCHLLIVVGAIRNNLDWCCEEVIKKWNTRIGRSTTIGKT